MTKKSQGMPINVIIMAVIGLVILIVLIAIFTGRAGIFSRNVGGSCADQGGICSTNGECNNQQFPIKIFASGCDYYKTNEQGILTPDTSNKNGQCCLAFK